MTEETVVSASAPTLKDETQLVTFLLKDEEFGFDIMSVQEIIRVPKMAKVPRSPDYVEGIANLRGAVLPIIDIRTRFGMERAEDTDRTRVLVIDNGGSKTGLRVDRVSQVTRVSRSFIEPPPAAIRGSETGYLDGVVKLEDGKRIIMALNADHICDISGSSLRSGSARSAGTQDAADSSGERTRDEMCQLVSFRIGREEFAFPMERVREILRVEEPKQVPDAPAHVLGVLTLRGQVLPILDLRRLLKQVSLGDELTSRCREVRSSYASWLEAVRMQVATSGWSGLSFGPAERLRQWVSDFNSSNQTLMELLSRLRAQNERMLKQIQQLSASGTRDEAMEADTLALGTHAVSLLGELEAQIPVKIHEDQRIIVVDTGSWLLGLVVDHVNEVLNVLKKSIEPPPHIAGDGGVELSGIAKLDEGNRLIMLLDVGHILEDERLQDLRTTTGSEQESKKMHSPEGSMEQEVQLVTFQLGVEEYGIPISQIQEIDRVSRITKVPKAPTFVEGVTNLRGEVIPVLNTRTLFELGQRPSDDRTRVIIVDLAGVKTGMIVDSVREVLSIRKSDIAPPPSAIQSGVESQFISGIGKVDRGKRMIVLLNVEQILSTEQHSQLAGMQETQ